MPPGRLAGWCPACLLDQGLDTEPGEPGGTRLFEPPSIEAVARLFPQLEIQSLLGAGGMGAVYKARQPALDRLVALKILPSSGHGRAGFAERFNREARALARLSHPNIVGVHEFGQVGDLHFFVMEYVDGANLRQLEKSGRLSPREALQIIPQICDALQYAHDEGVVHRDIKPENVLVDRRGRVKIADFGLAKIVGGDTETHRLTAEGQIMGTPLYMAPEQMAHPLSVDHRADIYSLGVVFYEMLTGDLPIGKFQPPSRKVQLDVRLDDIVLRALENDPERRYQQASEVKQRVATVVGSPASDMAGAASGGSSDAAPAAQPGAASAAPPPPAPARSLRYFHWAGIPVVVERDGEREVSFPGAMGALALTLICVAAGLFAVRLITGVEHVSPRIAFLVAGWVLFLGIRGTLRRPERQTRTPEGTLVVEPPGRFRMRRGYAALAGLIAFIVGVHFLKTEVIDSRNRGWGVQGPAVSKAFLNPATGTMTGSLPGGATVELLALADQDAAPNQWWRPDGRLETNLTYELVNPARSATSVPAAKDVILRVTGLPQGADSGFYESDPTTLIGGGGRVFRRGQALADLVQARFGWAPEVRQAKIRAGFCLEPWRPKTTFRTEGPPTHAPRQRGDPWWNVNLHRATDTAEGIQVTLVLRKTQPGWSTRLVLLDTNNTQHSYRQATGTPSDDTATWTYGFHGVTLAQVKEFQFQVRPIHWVEFKEVMLHPGSPPPPPKPLRFSEPVRLTLRELLDLDTDKVDDYPEDGSNVNPLVGIGENAVWVGRSGLDAEAGVGRLHVHDLRLVPLPDEAWDTWTPQQVADQPHKHSAGADFIVPDGQDPLPFTYSFLTREGGLGILQVLGFDADPPGVTLQYKRVTP